MDVFMEDLSKVPSQAQCRVTQVAWGVAWLDREAPGWRDRVNPERLELDDPERCVIGQVFFDFDTWLDEMELDAEWAEAHGFMARYTGSIAEWQEAYAHLNDLWRQEVTGAPVTA